MKKLIITVLLVTSAFYAEQQNFADARSTLQKADSVDRCPLFCVPRATFKDWRLRISPGGVLVLEYTSDAFHLSVGVGRLAANQ